MAAKDLYEKDFYKVLGVDKKAAADEIKRKYRGLVKDLHPDTNHGDSAKEEKFKAVSEAYEILSDPKKRAEYDEARSLFERGGFVYQMVEETFKAEISQTSSVEEIHKIFLQTFLVAVAVADHVKVKIYKQRPLLLSVNQYSVLI